MTVPTIAQAAWLIEHNVTGKIAGVDFLVDQRYDPEGVAVDGPYVIQWKDTTGLPPSPDQIAAWWTPEAMAVWSGKAPSLRDEYLALLDRLNKLCADVSAFSAKLGSAP